MKNLSIDIETFSSVDLKKEGLYKYAESDDFEILLFAYKLDNAPVEVIDLASGTSLPLNILQALYDSSITKSAYNASFEMVCINRYLQKLGNPPIPPEQWEDTMFLSAYAGYGGSLKTTAELLDLPSTAQKDRAGTQLINRFCKPRKPTAHDKRTRIYPEDDPVAWVRFKEYNRQDVVVEAAIREKLKDIEIPDKERAAFLLDHKIMSTGVLVDTDLVQAALDLDAEEKKRLKEDIFVLSGIDNPKSTVQTTEWLSKQLGHKVESIRKESVPELIEECKENNLYEAQEVLKLRQEFNKTSLAKYRSIKRMVCKDNRIRGMLQFYGSRTGRWAGRGVQVQNLPRNYISSISCARDLLKDRLFDGLKLIYGPNLSDIASQLIRTVFIPSPGKTFAVADYSAIEARVIAWLSGEEWRLNAFKNNQDIYCVSASQMFDVPLEKILDKNAPEHKLRAQGKVAELALGYQGGVNAIDRMDFNHAIPEENRPAIVKQWRDKSPRIVNFWKACETAAIEVIKNAGSPEAFHEYGVNNLLTFKCENNTLIVGLPSGRKLYYPKVKISTNPFGRESFEYQGLNQTTRKVETIYMYGGKLVENCLAGDTQVLTNRGWVRLDEVLDTDKVWDGNSWVSHSGLICRGYKQVIEIDGVRLTPEHKIYTQEGWVRASDSKSFNRYEVKLPVGCSSSFKTGLYELNQVQDNPPVFDLKNCGPNHCFTVLSDKGPLLVHNCVQAVARDCLSEAMLRLDQAGFDIKFHVHDEVILEVDSNKAQEELEQAIAIMCDETEWNKGLPLNAAGFTSQFYMKD